MKPKKERPSALPDSIFQAKLGKEESGQPEEIPVHNTFIQFGAPPSSANQKKPLSTAPAWVGPSFQNIFQEASASSAAEQAAEKPAEQPAEQPAAQAKEKTPDPPEEAEPPLIPNMDAQGSEPFFAAEEEESSDRRPLGSNSKLPMMRYALSSSSARAAGLPEWSTGAGASPSVGPPASQEDAKVSENGDSEKAENRGAALGPIGSPGPPSTPSGPLPSAGSAQHADGTCKRCCFFPKGRCQNGLNCEFCHFEHEKRKRKKKKKGARRDANADGSDSDEDSDEDTTKQGADASYAGGAGAWPASDPLGSMIPGLPLTAPPSLPPRGLPLPTEPPSWEPGALAGAGLNPGADPYYGGAYDWSQVAGYGAGLLGGYGAPPHLRPGAGALGNQSYFGAGYDPAAVAAQQQRAAFPPAGAAAYMPPPR